MTDPTIFGKIIRRELPADIVYEDDELIAFRDIAPQAPVHVLFVPKTPIATLNELQPEQAAVVGKLAYAAAQYAKREGFAEDGYRVVMLDGRVVAQADYGQERPGVREYWSLRDGRHSSDPQHPRVGFSATVELDAEAPGRHWLGLRLHGRDGSVEDWAEQPIDLRRR